MAILPIKPVELMQGKFTDFIGVWEDHLPKFVCDKVIQSFENAIDNSSNNFNQPDEDDANQPIIMNGSEQFSNRNLGRKDIGIMLNLHDAERTM